MRKLFTYGLFLFMLFLFLPGFAQQAARISGKITDMSNGSPISGATVVVKGSSTATQSDGQGIFNIQAKSTDILTVTYVGFKTKEVPVGSSTNLNIALENESAALEEVVVIGYGTAKKSDLTAPVTSVNVEDLNKRTTANPMQALQGSVSGVQVVTKGAPGSSATVRVRGVGSLNNENPLYVVDGMFVDNIDFLNSNDIEDMSILKDASGAAIYGVRAANGVVLITTKKGKMNMKTRVNYNGYVGFQSPTNMLKMANGSEYAAMQLLKRTSSDSSRVLLSVAKFGGSGLNPSTNTDWYSELLSKNAPMHSHAVDIMGGTDRVNYSFGANYLYQDGVMDAKNDYKRYNIRLQTEAKAFDWLKVGFTVHMSNSTLFSPENGAFVLAYYASPLYPVYDQTNNLAFPEKFASSTSLGYNNGVYNNPYAAAFYRYDRTKSFQVLPSFYADANIWKDKITFKTQFSQKLASNQNYNYLPEYYVDNTQRSALSKLVSIQDRYTNYIWDNLLTYKDQVNDHSWSVLLGQSVREDRWRNTNVSADNIPANEESWYVNQGTKSVTGYSEDGTRNAGLSYFARGTYDFKKTYLLTATFRADGSSKYQTKWGYFPSVGLGWVLSNESFLANSSAINFLKLRGSWGKLGNDGITANAGYATLNTGNDYSGIFGSMGLANGAYLPGYTIESQFSKIGWEVVEEWDAGLDFTLAKNKLKGSLDYYHRLTTGLAFNRTRSLRGGTIYGNFGDVANSGLELNLSWSDKFGDLGYKIGGNLTTLKNEVKDLGGLAYLSTGKSEFPTRIEVGQPLNFFYGYEQIGVYQNQAEVTADPIAVANNVQPGYFKYKDQNGDNVLDEKDRVNLGSYLPKVMYGFNVAFDYKNFDLGIAFQGQSGNKILNQNRALRSKYTDMNGDADFVTNLWTGEGSTNKYPSAYGTTQNYNYAANSFFVEDGSYLRIQNVQLGYSFSVGKEEKKTGIRLYITADRPAIFTKYNGFTPEITGTTEGGGYDSNTYPISSTYSFGVRVSY
ncbi:TonB-dependent receptor [Sphingobacterium sp. SRCM116780]|uniref:SusC/RagA family TonB-linked outer membrane protein n=1 Tax=Sphingobacterium sp. SRCM116780 TaxID=2907623 RepID=UPI001F46EDB2|nr:TonB-dependent receptor [Sphingobacterium sp. SRCM116780]UIR54689.1 TonB-dependent receptor [Sphingobacterium sp. SRCM116780]